MPPLQSCPLPAVQPLLHRVNHPTLAHALHEKAAVKAYILQEIEAEREAGKIDAFFVEAALLIEEGYGELLDELWYIFAQKEVRRKRLMQDRGYSEEKVEQIFASQLSEEEFRCHCKVVIDNSADLGDTYRQIDERLKEAGLSR